MFVTTACFRYQGHLPFAVVGSTEEVKIGNKMVKARQYPWGVVQGTLHMKLGLWKPLAGEMIWMCAELDLDYLKVSGRSKVEKGVNRYMANDWYAYGWNEKVFKIL